MRWGRARRPIPPTAQLTDHLDEVVALAREMLVDQPAGNGVRSESELRERVSGWLAQAGVVAEERGALVDATAAAMGGLGPLTSLLADAEVTEIMVNGTAPIWIESRGRMSRTDLRFGDAAAVRSAVDRLLAESGRRVDESCPTVDARLADGSRLNAVLPPVAVGGPLLTIRRMPSHILTLADLVERRALSRPMAAFLHAAVCGRANILVTGCAGAGKTTVLAALAALVPEDQRVVTIEDTAELRIDHPNVAAQQARPAAGEGVAEVSLRDLVRNSLRMRPDRIVVGEVRGVEAAEMLQAMTTGHSGSMATLHASSPDEAVMRLESMIALAWPGIDAQTLRRWIGSAVDVIVHCTRDASGHRRIGEVGGVEAERGELAVVPVFRADDERFIACGSLPRRCLVRLAGQGVRLSPSLFQAVPA